MDSMDGLIPSLTSIDENVTHAVLPTKHTCFQIQQQESPRMRHLYRFGETASDDDGVVERALGLRMGRVEGRTSR